MIIAGYRIFRRILTEWDGPCLQCGQRGHQSVVRAARWFTVFWIPLFPFHIKHTIRCEACGQQVRISRAQAMAITEGVAAAQAAGSVPLVQPFVDGYIGAVARHR